MSKRSCMRWDKRDRLQGCLALKRRLLFDYYRKTPGGIAPQCLRGFLIKLRKSVQTPQNRWPATVSNLTT